MEQKKSADHRAIYEASLPEGSDVENLVVSARGTAAVVLGPLLDEATTSGPTYEADYAAHLPKKATQAVWYTPGDAVKAKKSRRDQEPLLGHLTFISFIRNPTDRTKLASVPQPITMWVSEDGNVSRFASSAVSKRNGDPLEAASLANAAARARATYVPEPVEPKKATSAYRGTKRAHGGSRGGGRRRQSRTPEKKKRSGQADINSAAELVREEQEARLLLLKAEAAQKMVEVKKLELALKK